MESAGYREWINDDNAKVNTADTGLKMYRLDDANSRDIPNTLKTLLEENKAELTNDEQHFVILVHILMLETGFVANSSTASSSVLEVIRNVKKGCTLHYCLDSVKGTNCTVRLIRFSPWRLQCHIVQGRVVERELHQLHNNEIQERSKELNTFFTVSKFVPNAKSPNYALRFKNLRLLSKKFKNTIALPLLAAIKDSVSLQPGIESLEGLNDDALMEVLYWLNCPIALARLGQCSKRLRDLTEYDRLWEYFVKLEFPEEHGKILSAYNVRKAQDGRDWKTHYILLQYRGRWNKEVKDIDTYYENFENLNYEELQEFYHMISFQPGV